MNSRLEKMSVVFFTPAMHVNYVARFDFFFSNMNYGLISELEQTYDIRLTNDICVCIIINTPGRTNTLSQRILHRHFKHFLHTLKSLKFFVV